MDKSVPHRGAEPQRQEATRHGSASGPPSQTATENKKAPGQIAPDKEGMGSRAIHRHPAHGEVLKKRGGKKKSDQKQELQFLFRKVKLQFFEYITEKTFQAFGFCLAITINRW